MKSTLYVIIYVLTFGTLSAQGDEDFARDSMIASVLFNASKLYKEEQSIYKQIDSLIESEQLSASNFDAILYFLIKEKNPLGYDILIRQNKKFAHRGFSNAQEVIDGIVYPIQKAIIRSNIETIKGLTDYIYFSRYLEIDIEETGNLDFFRRLFDFFRNSGIYYIQGSSETRKKNLAKLINY